MKDFSPNTCFPMHCNGGLSPSNCYGTENECEEHRLRRGSPVVCMVMCFASFSVIIPWSHKNRPPIDNNAAAKKELFNLVGLCFH